MGKGFSDKLLAEFASGERNRLGFGCGQLHGGRSFSESIQLLDAAIDAGVSYFDTARLYGHGEAESVLGALSPAKKQKLCIASKVGVLPIEMTLQWRMRAKFASITGLLPPPAPLRPTFHAFSLSQMQKSVETSLKALKLDCIDILLLHECRLQDAESEQILEFLQNLKTSGKIKAYGIATGRGETKLIAENPNKSFEVFQFKDAVSDQDDIKVPADAFKVTHSCLSGVLQDLWQYFQSNAERFPSATHDRISNISALARDLIAVALQKNPSGLVLFSASKPERIMHNISATQVSREALSHVNEVVNSYLRDLNVRKPG